MKNRTSVSPAKVAFAIAAFLLTVNVGRIARAQVPTATVEEAHPRRKVSVTISPLHLTLPVLELTGEYRVLDKLGVAVVLGAGKVTPKATAGLPPPPSVPVWEAGLQGRYYLLGDFRHGMQIGAEAIYMHASLDGNGVSAVADGFSLGGFLGYKVMADVGFTFDCQLGYQVVGFGASATNGQMTASRQSAQGAVLLNLNVGWSF